MIERLEEAASWTVAAHRGYKSAYPENTLLSFEKAIQLGVDMLEFDLRQTKDGAVVVMHDETVDRTTNGSGKVSDFTLEELKRLDAGQWYGEAFKGLTVPTLRECCELLSAYPDVLLNVEIKPDALAKNTADRSIQMLNEFGCLDRCVFTSFDADIIAHIHDVYALKTQGFPEECMSNFAAGPDGTYSKMWAGAMPMHMLSAVKVRAFEELGILPWCYCPDDEAQVRQALACGVKLMTCNDPVPALRIRQG